MIAAMAYQGGQVVKADLEEARKRFRAACDGGLQEACEQLPALKKK